MSLKNITSASSGGALRRLYLFWRGHAGHAALRRVAHPGHGGLSTGGGKTPGVEPALHAADLALLRERHVGGHEPDLLALGLVPHDLGHLYGLRVVHGHVPREPGLRRAVPRLRVREVEPQRERREERRRCGEQQQERPRLPGGLRRHR
jgi:hypothetical protein